MEPMLTLSRPRTASPLTCTVLACAPAATTGAPCWRCGGVAAGFFVSTSVTTQPLHNHDQRLCTKPKDGNGYKSALLGVDAWPVSVLLLDSVPRVGRVDEADVGEGLGRVEDLDRLDPSVLQRDQVIAQRLLRKT